MHICMAYAEKMLPDRKGAIAPFVYELSKRLAAKNDVDLLGLGENEEYLSRFHLQTFGYNLHFYKLLSLIAGNSLAHHLLSNKYFAKELFKINRSFPVDILHVHDIYAAITGVSSKFLLAIPAVISVHNRLSMTWPLKTFDKVLPVSEYLKNELLSQGHIKSSKIQVMYPAVDTNLFKPRLTSNQAKNRLGLKGRKILLFVGRKCDEKGPKVILESLPLLIKDFPDLVAIFIGPDYFFGGDQNTYTNFLKVKAKNLNVDNNVIFEGHISEIFLKLYYEAADVFVFPSVWQEPFGLSLVEAMAFEKPVIATKVGGVPEIVKDEFNGLLVPPNDPSELAICLRQILVNRELAEYLGKNGRETVKRNFSYEILTHRCIQIYQEVLQN